MSRIQFTSVDFPLPPDRPNTKNSTCSDVIRVALLIFDHQQALGELKHPIERPLRERSLCKPDTCCPLSVDISVLSLAMDRASRDLRKLCDPQQSVGFPSLAVVHQPPSARSVYDLPPKACCEAVRVISVGLAELRKTLGQFVVQSLRRCCIRDLLPLVGTQERQSTRVPTAGIKPAPNGRLDLPVVQPDFYRRRG